MKHRRQILWLGLLIFVIFTVIGSAHVFLPITADSGESYTLTLLSSQAKDSYIELDFGKASNFRTEHTTAAEALLHPSAIGETYEITARYHSRYRKVDYYEVYSLTGTDGTRFVTLEESEVARQEAVPVRVILLVVIDLLLFIVVLICDRRIVKQRANPSDNAA